MTTYNVYTHPTTNSVTATRKGKPCRGACLTCVIQAEPTTDEITPDGEIMPGVVIVSDRNERIKVVNVYKEARV